MKRLVLAIGAASMAIGAALVIRPHEPTPSMATQADRPSVSFNTKGDLNSSTPPPRITMSKNSDDHTNVDTTEALNEEIRLTGIMKNSANPELSYAIIENSNTKGVPSRVGSLVKQGIVLTQIHSDHIYVKKDGQQCRVDIVQTTSNTHSDHTRPLTLNSASPVYQAGISPPPNSHRVTTPLAANYQPHASENRDTFAAAERRKYSPLKSQTTGNAVKAVVATATNYQQGSTAAYVPAATGRFPTKQAPFPESTNGESQIKMPDFMYVANSDAYVPDFMKDGELNVLWNQIPEYMKTGPE